MDETTLAFLDRLVEPLRSELHSVNGKLDRMLAMGERVAVAEQAHSAHEARIDKVEKDSEDAKKSLAQLRGRNEVILWLLTLIGCPSLMVLITAGINFLMGHGPGH